MSLKGLQRRSRIGDRLQGDFRCKFRSFHHLHNEWLSLSARYSGRARPAWRIIQTGAVHMPAMTGREKRSRLLAGISLALAG